MVFMPELPVSAKKSWLVAVPLSGTKAVGLTLMG